MSNLERQRRFQANHPGYDRRRKARGRVTDKRAAKQMVMAWAAQARAAEAAEAAAAVEAKPQLLMLPAPVEHPMMNQLNAMAASLAASPAREPLPLAQQATPLWFVQR
jgi:hypothetical protein